MRRPSRGPGGRGCGSSRRAARGRPRPARPRSRRSRTRAATLQLADSVTVTGTNLPPVTAELVERLEAPLEAFGVARVEALADLPGNPLGLRIERFGDVVAPAAVAEPELDFVNRIGGLGPRTAGRLESALAFYAELGLRPWLEIPPGLELPLPEGAIVGYQAVLYGRPASPEPPLPVRETDDLAGTASLILEGFGVPDDIVEQHGDALAEATERTGGRAFVVDLDGRRAGGGILTVRDGVGYLALAATLPAFRGRGCQSALIAGRMAAASDCELIVATAAFPSQSQRNLERAGLRIAYTKASWRRA